MLYLVAVLEVCRAIFRLQRKIHTFLGKVGSLSTLIVEDEILKQHQQQNNEEKKNIFSCFNPNLILTEPLLLCICIGQYYSSPEDIPDLWRSNNNSVTVLLHH